MAYYASFDARNLATGLVSFTKSGGGTITLNPSAFEDASGFGVTTTFFNFVLTNAWHGFGVARTPRLMSLAVRTFFEYCTVALRLAATDAGWPSPTTINVIFNPATRRVTFAYPTGFTAITFANFALRRLFGFAANFAGSSTSVAGGQLPTFIVEPTIDGASAASVVHETAPICNVAYSANGRSFAMGRTTSVMSREWTQQFETRAKVFKRYADDPTNDFTYQHFFETVRAQLPFAVFDGFEDAIYSAYQFAPDADAFVAEPAVPGSADYFHLRFRTVALARVTGLTLTGAFLTFDADEVFA